MKIEQKAKLAGALCSIRFRFFFSRSRDITAAEEKFGDTIPKRTSPPPSKLAAFPNSPVAEGAMPVFEDAAFSSGIAEER